MIERHSSEYAHGAEPMPSRPMQGKYRLGASRLRKMLEQRAPSASRLLIDAICGDSK
jgi:hypothetical protein